MDMSNPKYTMYGFRGDKDIRTGSVAEWGSSIPKASLILLAFYQKQKLRINCVYHTTYLSEVRIISFSSQIALRVLIQAPRKEFE
jgi:hypothetical protein